MFFVNLINNGNVPALEKMVAFTEARHQVLVENVANVDTPGYKTKQLDPAAFQKSLRQALENRRLACASGPTAPGLTLRDTAEVKQDANGRLRFEPSIEQPADNILFHDQTNQRIERQMAALAENAMMHQTATDLLRSRFQSLTKAISGRVA